MSMGRVASTVRSSSRLAASELTAVELIERVLADADEPVTLVATGPITNVATLLRRDAVDRSRIREVMFMGGSVDRGNHTPTAEFNTYADPEALAIVLGSGLPVRMVGLNLTHQALATPEVVARMRAMEHHVGQVAAEWMGFFGSSYRAIWEFDAPPVHDPCTVAALIRPELIGWRRCFVAVETAGEWTRGTTVVDSPRPLPASSQRRRRDHTGLCRLLGYWFFARLTGLVRVGDGSVGEGLRHWDGQHDFCSMSPRVARSGWVADVGPGSAALPRVLVDLQASWTGRSAAGTWTRYTRMRVRVVERPRMRPPARRPVPGTAPSPDVAAFSAPVQRGLPRGARRGRSPHGREVVAIQLLDLPQRPDHPSGRDERPIAPQARVDESLRHRVR